MTIKRKKMKKEKKNEKCGECQFENGEHSQACSEYKEIEFKIGRPFELWEQWEKDLGVLLEKIKVYHCFNYKQGRELRDFIRQIRQEAYDEGAEEATDVCNEKTIPIIMKMLNKR